jgi:hypothetical protein
MGKTGIHILWSFGINYYILHMIYFVAFGNLMAIGRILPRFGTLCQEKSGNPAAIVGKKSNQVFP